jgi:hypothetical protein
MFDNPTAVWAAIAASFSALSSFLIWRVQRHNFLESIRPELVLSGWSRKEETWDTITFDTIRNVGRGVAIRVMLRNADEWFATRFDPTAKRRWEFSAHCDSIQILAPGETMTIPGRILLCWDAAVPDKHGQKYISVLIGMFCWDSRWTRYETIYQLLAVAPVERVGGDDLVAPGLFLHDRRVRIRSALSFKIANKLRGFARKLIAMNAAVWGKIKDLRDKMKRK